MNGAILTVLLTSMLAGSPAGVPAVTPVPATDVTPGHTHFYLVDETRGLIVKRHRDHIALLDVAFDMQAVCVIGRTERTGDRKVFRVTGRKHITDEDSEPVRWRLRYRPHSVTVASDGAPTRFFNTTRERFNRTAGIRPDSRVFLRAECLNTDLR